MTANASVPWGKGRVLPCSRVRFREDSGYRLVSLLFDPYSSLSVVHSFSSHRNILPGPSSTHPLLEALGGMYHRDSFFARIFPYVVRNIRLQHLELLSTSLAIVCQIKTSGSLT